MRRQSSGANPPSKRASRSDAAAAAHGGLHAIASLAAAAAAAAPVPLAPPPPQGPPPLVAGQRAAETILATMGQVSLREALDGFQAANGLAEKFFGPTLPVLKLLDLHGLARPDIYATLLEQLVKRLVAKLESTPLPPQEYEQLLLATFPYVSFPELRLVPLTILRVDQRLHRAFLDQLHTDPELYAACPLEIRRQIWQVNETKFREVFLPLLERCVGEAAGDGVCSPADDYFSALSPSQRREKSQPLKDLVHIVGNSYKLFKSLVSTFRQLFITTKNYTFCTLRMDLIMAIHEEGVSEVYEQDECHQFAWYVDSYLREDILEGRRLSELLACVDELPVDSPLLADFAMVLADRSTRHALTRWVYAAIERCVEAQSMPSDDLSLTLLLRLLSLSYSAHQKKPQVSVISKEGMSKFLSALISRLVDDQIRTLENSSEVPNLSFEILSRVEKGSMCRRIMLFYALKRAQANDPTAVLQVTAVQEPEARLDSDDAQFAQSLATIIINNSTKSSLRQTLLDHYFFSGARKSPHLLTQSIRIISESHARLTYNYLQKLLKSVAQIVSELPLTPLDASVMCAATSLYTVMAPRFAQLLFQQHYAQAKAHQELTPLPPSSHTHLKDELRKRGWVWTDPPIPTLAQFQPAALAAAAASAGGAGGGSDATASFASSGGSSAASSGPSTPGNYPGPSTPGNYSGPSTPGNYAGPSTPRGQ